MKKHWSGKLLSVGPNRELACQEAIDWARTQPSLAVAWNGEPPRVIESIEDARRELDEIWARQIRVTP